MGVFSAFTSWWTVEDYYIHPDTDLIVPISAGTYNSGALTRATEEAVLRSILFWRQCKKARIAFTNSSKSFHGNNVIEAGLKKELFRLYGLYKSQWTILPDKISKSLRDEAFQVREITRFSRIYPQRILLVGGAIESRLLYEVWRRAFPDAYISISCIRDTYEYGARYPSRSRRTRRRWIFSRVALWCAYKIFGRFLFRRFRKK